MTDWRFELEERALLFASERSQRIIGQLGYGYDGTVFATDRQSALKVLRFARLYERERDIYKRLQQSGVYSVLGFAVPQLIDYSDDVMVIEIGIVSPPFVLDFAGAYLDQRPDYPDVVLEEWMEDKRLQFGDERWDIVQSIMAAFRGFGIHLADVKPGNIMFAD